MANIINLQGEKIEDMSFENLNHKEFNGVGQFSIKLKGGELYMIHVILLPAAAYTGFFGFAVIRDAGLNVSLMPVFPASTDGGFKITLSGDTIIFECGWGYRINYWKLDFFR